MQTASKRADKKKKSVGNTTPPISSLISALHSSVPTRNNKPQAASFFRKHLKFMRSERKKRKTQLPASCRTVFFGADVAAVRTKVFSFALRGRPLHVIRGRPSSYLRPSRNDHELPPCSPLTLRTLIKRFFFLQKLEIWRKKKPRRAESP